MTIDQAMQIALEHHRAGRLAEAEAIYRQVLARCPDHADALHLLGVLAGQTGHTGCGDRSDRPGDRRQPGRRRVSPAIWARLTAERGNGNGRSPASAARSNRSPSLPRPTSTWAWRCRRRAGSTRPSPPTAVRSRSARLCRGPQQPRHRLARSGPARRGDRRLPPGDRAASPTDAEAHNNLGVALHEQGRLDEAIAACRRALALRPDYAEAHSNLGVALNGRAGSTRRSPPTAVRSRSSPTMRGIQQPWQRLSRSGRLDEAISACGRAVALRPDYAEAHMTWALRWRRRATWPRPWPPTTGVRAEARQLRGSQQSR